MSIDWKDVNEELPSKTCDVKLKGTATYPDIDDNDNFTDKDIVEDIELDGAFIDYGCDGHQFEYWFECGAYDEPEQDVIEFSKENGYENERYKITHYAIINQPKEKDDN